MCLILSYWVMVMVMVMMNMRMPMHMLTALSSLMMEVMEEDKSNHVDEQSYYRYWDESLVFNLDWLKDPLYRFDKDIVRNEYEKDTVEKTADGLDLGVAKGELVVGVLELGDVGGY